MALLAVWNSGHPSELSTATSSGHLPDLGDEGEAGEPHHAHAHREHDHPAAPEAVGELPAPELHGHDGDRHEPEDHADHRHGHAQLAVQVDALEGEGQRGRGDVDEDAHGQHPELGGEGAELRQLSEADDTPPCYRTRCRRGSCSGSGAAQPPEGQGEAVAAAPAQQREPDAAGETRQQDEREQPSPAERVQDKPTGRRPEARAVHPKHGDEDVPARAAEPHLRRRHQRHCRVDLRETEERQQRYGAEGEEAAVAEDPPVAAVGPRGQGRGGGGRRLVVSRRRLLPPARRGDRPGTASVRRSECARAAGTAPGAHKRSRRPPGNEQGRERRPEGQRHAIAARRMKVPAARSQNCGDQARVPRLILWSVVPRLGVGSTSSTLARAMMVAGAAACFDLRPRWGLRPETRDAPARRRRNRATLALESCSLLTAVRPPMKIEQCCSPSSRRRAVSASRRSPCAGGRPPAFFPARGRPEGTAASTSTTSTTWRASSAPATT